MSTIRVQASYPNKAAEIKIGQKATLGEARGAAGKALGLDLEQYTFTRVAFGKDVEPLRELADDKALEWEANSLLYAIAPPSIVPPRETKAVATEEEEDKFAGLKPINVWQQIPKWKGAKRKIIMEYLDLFSGEILKAPVFLQQNEATVVSYLKRDTLWCSEVEVFDAAVAWGTAQLKKSSTPNTPDNLKKVLANVLPLVRFPVMATEDVATKVAGSNLLDQQQILDLFTYLAQAGDTKSASSPTKVPKSLSGFNAKGRAGSGSSILCEPPPKSDLYAEKPMGVFATLGRLENKNVFSNPHTSGVIVSYREPSTTWSGSVNETQLVDSLASSRGNSTDSYLNGLWFAADLKNYRLQPTHYSMRNGGGRGLVLRDWTFEAKENDSDSWEVLDRHTNDGAYADDGQNGFGLLLFPIAPAAKKFYKHFRIQRTDNKKTFYVHRWEMYGILKKVGK